MLEQNETEPQASPAENHAYALQVVAKQAKLVGERAEALLASIDEAALVVAGRAGNVAAVRELLGVTAG